MAVLIEGLSAVIRIDAFKARVPGAGGWKVFNANAPGANCCRDGELARVDFKASWSSKAILESIKSLGLISTVDGMARGVVVVDQMQGPAMACDWIEGAREGLEDGPKRREWASC